jgi:hypothetical protein
LAQIIQLNYITVTLYQKRACRREADLRKQEILSYIISVHIGASIFEHHWSDEFLNQESAVKTDKLTNNNLQIEAVA